MPQPQRPSRKNFLIERELVAWIARTLLFAALFATALALVPDSAGIDESSRLVATLELLSGLPLIPGMIAFMLSGGVHGSRLSDEQTIALISIISAAFWASILPAVYGIPEGVRRLLAWRRSL